MVYKFRFNEFHRRSYLLKALVIGLFLDLLVVVIFILLDLNQFFDLTLGLCGVILLSTLYYFDLKRIKDLQKVYKTEIDLGKAIISITKYPLLDFFGTGNVATPKSVSLKLGSHALGIYPFYKILFIKLYESPMLIYREDQSLLLQNLDYPRGSAIVNQALFKDSQTILKLNPKSEYIDDFEIVFDMNLQGAFSNISPID